MLELCFSVENQILEREDKQVLVNKSRNYLNCNFTFTTDDWKGVEKFAIFKNEDGEAFNVYLGRSCECLCTPPDLVLTGNYFNVSVYGGDRITTNEKTVVLIPSGYTTEISSDDGSDSKDVFTQVFELINEKIDDIVMENGLLNIYSDGVLVKSVNPADDTIVTMLMQEFSSEFDENLQRFVDTQLDQDSTNPVQNKIITNALDDKADTVHSHVSSDVVDMEDVMSVDVKRALNDLTASIRTYGEQ